MDRWHNKKPHARLVFLPEADPNLMAEHIVAFANTDGGLIVLGIDEDGTIVDPIWEEEAEGSLRQAIRQCTPPIPTKWESWETPQAQIIGIQVDRSPQLHTLTDGRILVRRGNHNHPLQGHEIQLFAAGKNVADYEAEAVIGATRQDFDPEIVAEYLAKREARGASKIGSIDELLFEIGAIDHTGAPTVAGMLLFGKNPRTFLPQTGVVFVRFSSTESRGESGRVGYSRRDEIDGPLARIIERSWNIIWEEMRNGAVVHGLERKELTEYPRFAVREALVNAVCHRDYQLKGRRIEIRMYTDRLEIISPGQLPGYMTIDNLVEEHFSRNPRIVNGLFQWGYIEELGLGIDQMIEEMVNAGHHPPKFFAAPYSFKVQLLNQREHEPRADWTHSMSERQTKALSYVREHGSITNREYQRLCPELSPETLRLDLSDLVDRNLLLKIGSKKGTHYILK